MATQNRRAASDGTANPTQDLMESAFQRLQQFGTSPDLARLFPGGLESLQLDVDSGASGRISIALKGAPAAAPAAVDDAPTVLAGDVEASFNAEGHKVIALIAAADLQQRFPNTRQKVQQILDDGGRDLLSAAIFPDEIRNTHPETKPFHFVDFAFEVGGPTQPPLPPSPHVIVKIAEFSAELKKSLPHAKRVDDLSWLIHLFGDIHQPLHCITRITSAHPRPDGDRGGNSFALKGTARNLHALWDSSVSFTAESEQELADSILTEHSRASLSADLKISDVEKWARNSFNLARKNAYGPLTENPSSPPRPSAQYLANALKIGRRQAALAGFRLADRLHELLG